MAAAHQIARDTLLADGSAREPTVIRATAPCAWPYELAIIVPTLNEAENVGPLVELLSAALAEISWEVIFVDDDSTDRTYDAVYRLAAGRPNIRCLRRVGRRGLASAAIEGMMATGAPFVAVMDADLQHDEALLPKMLSALKGSDLDIIVASRFAAGSSAADFSAAREKLSRLGNRLARWVTGVELTDPLSGFFMLRRDVLDEIVRSLTGKGFKILLDILASSDRPLRCREMPMTFRARQAGSSKLDTLVGLEFIMLLGDKALGDLLPIRFVIFVLVGLSGVAVHLTLLALFFRVFEAGFYWSQVAATLIAMTNNFYFNNKITYRDRKLRGAKEFLRGLFSFYVACAIGAFANFQVAAFLYEHRVPWFLAGLLGLTVSSVWNYGVTSTFTWKAATR